MSTDGDRTKGSGTDGEPDEFDSLVLDEDFIKGGVAEASLRRYQVVREQRWLPPHRTAASGPRDSSSTSSVPAESESVEQHSAGSDDGLRQGNGSGPVDRSPRGFAGLMFGAAAVLVMLVVLTGMFRFAQSSSSSLPVNGQTGVLTSSILPGTCFDLPINGGGNQSVSIAVELCSRVHAFEFVDLERAVGPNDQYPSDRYWSSMVTGSCTSDLQTYTGKPHASWPDTLYAEVIPPAPSGWANGDRTVYCVAWIRPSSAGSVRG